MPEGDTVYLAARRLDRALSNRVLTRTEFRVPRFATVDMAGKRVLETVARGKHLLTRIEGGNTLHTHFKMEGSWHLYRPGQRWKGPDFQVRAVLATDERVAVGMRLGITEIVPTDRESEVVGHLGPDPLGLDWDLATAVERVESDPLRPFAEAMIDQRNVAGFGNVYKCELCFLRGVNPWTRVADVDVSAALELGHRLIRANRETGMQITTGEDRPGRRHWVYGRGGEPCRRCGTRVERAQQGGERVTYWCPACQPAGVEPSMVGGTSRQKGYSD